MKETYVEAETGYSEEGGAANLRRSAKNGRKRTLSGIKIAPYFFCAPFFITYCVFTLFSMVFTLAVSFTEWDGFGEMSFNRFANYLRFFDYSADPRFYQSLLNTFILVVCTMPVGIILALFLCYFLNKKLIGKKHLFRVLYYLPALMTPVAVGLLWSILFDYENGTVNKVLMTLGLIKENIYWMGSAWGCRFVLSVLIVWSSFGSTVLFLSSALASVSESVVEAATIDGAGPLTTYIKICMPAIRDVLVFIIITGLINSFQMYDAPVLLFSSGPSGGLPYGGTDRGCLTMLMLIMEEAFTNGHYGYASALSYGMFLVIGIFSFVSMKLMTRWEEL